MTNYEYLETLSLIEMQEYFNCSDDDIVEIYKAVKDNHITRFDSLMGDINFCGGDVNKNECCIPVWSSYDCDKCREEWWDSKKI